MSYISDNKLIIEAYQKIVSESVKHDIAISVAKEVKVPKITKGTYNYKADGKSVPGHTAYYFDKDTSHQAIYDALTKQGFKKSESKKDDKSFNISTNQEEMSINSDPVHTKTHSAWVDKEHGGKLRLIVHDRSVK